jgi:uncharacterized protein (TIGR02271 family)
MSAAARGSNKDAEAARDGDSMVRSEEELEVGIEREAVGEAHVRKHVDTDHVREVVSRGVERAEVERDEPVEGDSGQIETLPDGSVSVPVFEEVLVVEKRMVVRERVIIRKSTVTEEHVVEADLKRERVEVDVDGPVADRVHETRRD